MPSIAAHGFLSIRAKQWLCLNLSRDLLDLLVVDLVDLWINLGENIHIAQFLYLPDLGAGWTKPPERSRKR